MKATLSNRTYGPYRWGFRPARLPRSPRQRTPSRSRRRTFDLEPFEPRLLLSADTLVAGLTGATQAGLAQFGTTVFDALASNANFDTPVPGVIQSTHDVNHDGKLDKTDVHDPTATDVLSLNVNRDGSTDSNGNETIDALETSVNKNDPKDVYRYLSGQKFGFFPTNPERALSAMDTNNDHIVSPKEIYQALVVGAVADYLDDYSSIGTVADLENNFSAFLNILTEPSILSSLIDLDLTSVSNDSGSGSFAFSFNLHLAVKDYYVIDLGLEADKYEIQIPDKEFNPGSPGVDPSVTPIPDTARTVQLLGSFDVPFSFSVDISSLPVVNDDFSFAVPNDITVAVQDNVAGSGGETLANLIANVGFLGTQAPATPSDSKYNLYMEWDVSVTDPSSPVSLGFAQALPITSTTGIIVASKPLPNDPGTSYVFPQDVLFTLKLGELTNPVAVQVRVTAASTTDNSSAADKAEALRADVQTALDNAGLGIVKAKLDGSTLNLVLDDTDVTPMDITPLGYANNQISDDTGPAPYLLDAGSPPSILGHTSSDTIKFLLSVGGAVPKLVTVTTTPGNDDNNGDGTLGDLSLAGLIADINNALAAVGLGVTASDIGGKVRLSAGSTLEVTRTLKLDAKNQITYAELTDPSITEFIKAEQNTSNDEFQVVLPLGVRDGLEFTPAGNPGVKIDIKPFSYTSTKADASGIQRLEPPLTDLNGTALDAGGSEFVQYLDFNVISPGGVIGMIQQLDAWLQKFRQTDMLGKFNIPFAQAVLGKLLAFDDMISDSLINDDNDTTDKTDDDTGKLMAMVSGFDAKDPSHKDFVAAFGTAQELGARLWALADPRILVTTPSGDYGSAQEVDAKGNRLLTYHLSLANVFAADNVAVNILPNIDLSPLGNISSQSKIHLEATGHFDAVLGIQLGPGKIDDSTLLSSINGGIGAGIQTGIAFTGGEDARLIQGRLSADAHFDVILNGLGPVRVTVTQASTAANTAWSDLVSDINTALAGTVLGTYLQADLQLNRIVLKAKDGAGVSSFSVTTSTSDTAYTELGLPTTVATGVYVSVTPTEVSVSSNVNLSFFVNGSSSSSAAITLLSGDSATAGATGGNLTITDLANDINATLAGTPLAGKIAAARNGDKLVLASIDGSIQSFKVVAENVNLADPDDPKSKIGLSDPAVAAVYLLAPKDVNAVDVTNVFGRLTGDAHFSIGLNSEASVGLTILQSEAEANKSVEDLVKLINSKIQAAPALQDKVKAEQVGNYRISLRAIDPVVLSFSVEALAADPAVTAMGLFAGTQTAKAALNATAIKEAPYFYGPSTNATFNVTITGGPQAGTKTVTVSTAECLSDATIQDLVGDVRRALDAAFGGVEKNPLAVSNDGDRILLSPRASFGITAFSITADVANPAITDLKLYQAGTTLPASGDVTSGADTADLLIYTGNGLVHRVTLDGQTTIGGVRGAINGLLGSPVTASLNDIGEGLKLVDNTVGSALFRIDSLNGSHAAQALGIFGADTDINHPTPDKEIDGTRIVTLQMGDRFFLRQVDASTNILGADVTFGAATFDGSSANFISTADSTIKIQQHGFITGDAVVYSNGGGTDVPGLTNGQTYYVIAVGRDTLKLAASADDATNGAAVALFGTGTGTTHRLQNLLLLDANFGFVGIRLAGSGALTGQVGVGLVDKSATAELRMAALLDALSKDQDGDGDVDVFDLATKVTFPSVSLTGDLALGVEVYPALTKIVLGGTPTVTLHVSGAGNPFLLKAGAVAPYDVSDFVSGNPSDPNFTLTLPDITVNTSGLGDLGNFPEIGFSSILEALKGVRDFLNQFSAFSFLDTEIPLIGKSFNDLIGIADRFAKAVEEIEKNPAGAIQGLEQKIRETFGLPPGGSDIFDINLVDNQDGDGNTADMLKVSLNLTQAFYKALSVDLDLNDQIPGLRLLGTAGLNASGSLGFKLALGVDLDDPTNPDKLVLFTNKADTGISGKLGASADNVTFNAALGPLGTFISGGNVSLDLALGFENSGAAVDSRVALLDAFNSGGFEPSFTGAIKATLPVFFPTQSNFVGDIGFDGVLSLDGSGKLEVGGGGLTLPEDILHLDFSNFDIFSNLPLMIDAGDQFLSGLQDILDGQVLGYKLPLIGDKLAEGARFIENFRKDFVEPLRQLVETAPQKTKDLVQEWLFDVLNSTGLLQDITGDDAVTKDDVKISSGNDFVQFNFQIGQTYSPDVNLNIDVGFPGLNFQAKGELGLTLGWNLGLGFGISLSEGAYIDIARDGDTSKADLNVSVDANLGTTTLSGTLGFLQLVLTPMSDDFDGRGAEYTDKDGPGPLPGDTAEDPTKIHAEFGVNLKNGDNAHLSLFELGNLEVETQVIADAEVNLEVTAQLDPSLLPDTISAALPKIQTRLLLDWEIGTRNPGSDLLVPVSLSEAAMSLGDGLKLLEFRDVGIDFGSFLGDTVGPIVAKIQEITGPLQPIIDICTARIPVLSDLAGRTITLLDIAAAFGDFDPGMIYAIADIISLVNSINTGAGDSLFVTLGSFKLVDSVHPEQSLLGDSGGSSLADPNFDFSDDKLSALGIGDFVNKLTGPGGLLSGLGDLTDSANLDNLLNGQGLDPSSSTATTTKSLFSGGFSSTPDKSGFDFPIFKNPAQIFGLLLGRNATLITYDLPPFGFDFKWEVSFPIYPPLYGLVTMGLGLKIDLAFGYDTEGIRQFAEGGFENPLDLIAGFYISDTDKPDGSFGVDVPELVFKGNIGIGAELNLGIASAGVTANIILTVNFDLFDPNHDGKVRINELVSTFLFEARNGNPLLAPMAIFDIYGDISFQLSAFIKFLFFRLDFDITPPIVLFEFKIPFDREPILATERGDGSVLLNIGPNASARENGDTRDISEEIHAKDGGDGKVAVWSDQFGVPESAAQLYSIGGKNPVVVGIGGEGDDIIDVSGLTSYAASLEGGSGNDTLKGGEMADIIKGDIGDDVLLAGNGGNDVIYGGDGNDTIDGGAGNDIIFGDAGAVSMNHDNGSIRSSIGKKDGIDTITGGTGQDIIFGGGGDDKIGGDVAATDLDGGGATDNDFIFGDGGRIEAPDGVPMFDRVTNPDGTITFSFISLTDRKGGGNDTINAHDGADVVFGGSGNDTIDAGGGDDIVFGESGFDLISGAAGMDTIMGGTEDDRIFGYRNVDYADAAGAADGADTIFGQAGNDFIRGNGGDDFLYGNAGADITFGDQGNDTISGDTEPDIIFGGPDRDIIDAGTGNDIVFGDDGIVVWVDFYSPGEHKVIGRVGNTVNTTEGYPDQHLTDAQLTAIPHTDDILTTDDAQIRTMDLILTEVNGGTDGNDTITGGEGDDIVLGGADQLYNGVKGDTIFGDFNPGAVPGTAPSGPIPAGQDILIGDGGRVQFNSRRRDNIRTIVGAAASEVGNDTILGNGGDDTIFGCGAADVLYGRMDALYTNSALAEDAEVTDNDIILGDDGEIDYAAGTGIIQKIFTNISAGAISVGGIDYAYGNKGDDIILGGIAGDFLKGDSGGDGDDIIFGDNGEIDYALDDDGVTTKISKLFTTDVSEGSGGADTVEGQEDDDIILGGVNNGGVDRLYGDRATSIPALDGQDIILGDNGTLDFAYNGDPDLDTLDLISSKRDNLGGADDLSGNAFNDVLIGGTGGDTMYGDDATASAAALDGEDIMLGDNADLFLAGSVGRLIVRNTAVDLITTTDTAETTGGADTMSGNAKADIILGGVNNGGQDTLYGDRGTPNATTIGNDADDILLGDNGLLDFTFADTDRNTLDLIRSAQDTRGGVDIISGNKGADVAIGGTAGDTIYGDEASFTAGAADLADILLGDNADIFLVAKSSAAGGDLKVVLDAAVKTIQTTDTVAPLLSGGSDTISGNAKGDIIAGGVYGDTLYGDRSTPTPATTGDDGNDIILGDNGALEWLSNGRLVQITGIDINANNPALWAKYGSAEADTDLTTLDLVTTEQPDSGGRDLIYGDEGKDVVFGGTDTDTIYGDDGSDLPEGSGTNANNDVLFGDHGRLYPQFSALAGFNSRNFFSIDVGDDEGGEGDLIWGEEGADVILGGQGDDRMWGGRGDDDMIGGHNVAGGYDELTSPTINAAMDPAVSVPAIQFVNDAMDGGTGNDAMAGDNAILWRRGDDLSPRFRALAAGKSSIYSTDNSTITANIGAVAQSDPKDAVGRDIQLLDHSDGVQTDPKGRFGNDVMAGGADNDVMFGQLDADLMQGDGYIGADDANAGTLTFKVALTDSGVPSTAQNLFFNIPEAATDGDDYLEGNGGDDLMYGGLGQDDMIGGSSDVFGLTDETMRPDGSDIIYGGAGIDISRNNIGDAAEDANHLITTVAMGHSRDADYIMGDNANVFRLVQGGASGTNPEDLKDQFLAFNYDDYDGGLRIIPRAMEQLDYTLGGGDYGGGGYNASGQATPTGKAADNGGPDVIHGESGDDTIFGMTGSDIIFGEGQDDDIVGGYGNDWISGGTGQDGVLGDDGLIYVSRNSTIGEPLYAISGLLEKDPDPKYSNGNVLNEVIATPGNIQYAIINQAGELKKTMDLVPFSFDKNWNATDDEFPDNADNTPFADDIIFGGLGSDFLHGGSGDDAISGAEGLEHAYVPILFDASDGPHGILDLGYSAVGLPATTNPGDAFAFNPVDLNGQHLNNRYRAGEFLYDEYDPLRKILLKSDGTLWKPGDPGTGLQFLLNFEKTEGVVRPGGTVPKATGQQTDTYGPVNDDGGDAIFGDLGNDWLVGGTGADDMYGGWGNDLINADDNHDSTDGTSDPTANNVPDTHPYYQDRAYGGAGRDVLIGNTGGDRLIDWVGEYNSYLVPYAPFGQASVSRTLQPQLQEFLYALSRADGADQTRPADTGADPLRNGEPNAEMGLVLQKDFAWQAQTGAPSDPQAGNIPGGKRDVLRSAGFNDGTADGFVADSGTWKVAGGRYQVSPTVQGGDAVSVFYVDSYIPNYFEMTAAINAAKPTGGNNSNAYLIFDYQGPTDFKFAGINVSTNKLEMGHRTAQGWVVDKEAPFPGSIKSGTDYNMFLALNGTNATLIVNNRVSLAYTFAVRTDVYGISHGLNDGMVGLGARNSTAAIDDLAVQRLAPQVTLDRTIDFSSEAPSLLDSPLSGTWKLGSGRYEGAAGTTPAVNLCALQVSPSCLLDLSAKFSTTDAGGFVYDVYSVTDFKFVTVSVATKQILLGHRTSRGWFTDMVVSNSNLAAGVDYTLGLTLQGTTVNVTLNGQTVASRAYSALVTDGSFGLLSRSGKTSFDSVTLKTDDPAFASSVLV